MDPTAALAVAAWLHAAATVAAEAEAAGPIEDSASPHEAVTDLIRDAQFVHGVGVLATTTAISGIVSALKSEITQYAGLNPANARPDRGQDQPAAPEVDGLPLDRRRVGLLQGRRTQGLFARAGRAQPWRSAA